MKNKKIYFSFSLYESTRENFDYYARGAVENYNIIKLKYPEAKCVFYIDDKKIENKYVQYILSTDSIIYMKKNTNTNQIPVIWRFEALFDIKDYDVVFFRDTDSVITKREDNLIEEFLNSDKKCHVIRDYPHKTQNILAGMWGLKFYNEDIKKIIYNLYDLNGEYGFEENYFQTNMWNLIKDVTLLHDYKLTPEKFENDIKDNYIGKRLWK
jgi:hypothetical protein